MIHPVCIRDTVYMYPERATCIRRLWATSNPDFTWQSVAWYYLRQRQLSFLLSLTVVSVYVLLIVKQRKHLPLMEITGWWWVGELDGNIPTGLDYCRAVREVHVLRELQRKSARARTSRREGRQVATCRMVRVQLWCT